MEPYTHKRLPIAISQFVNSYFRAPDLKEDSTPRTYEKILFEDVPYAPEQLTYALKHRQEYRQDFQKAIAVATADLKNQGEPYNW